MGEQAHYLDRHGLGQLLERLTANGYRLIGPRVKQGTVQYRELQDTALLPWGVRQEQRPGEYHLQRVEGGRAFAWANGPQGLKPYLFAPEEPLWRVVRDERGGRFEPLLPAGGRLAILGVRPCDLAALALQDQHFLQGGEADAHYARRREGLFLIAVNCSHPASTCFCAATGDGPNAGGGYDLLLDELDEGFIATAGSLAGEEVLTSLPLTRPTAGQRAEVEAQRRVARGQQRHLPPGLLPGALSERAAHPRWEAIAARCLACGNCTAVCPTCFCHSEHDVPQLDGGASVHLRQWASCFSADHSMLHGIPVRAETAQRYRQWLTHKFDHWHAQYGRSGCVGCGRCLTWCPVGIDVTAELAQLCGGEG